MIHTYRHAQFIEDDEIFAGTVVDFACRVDGGGWHDVELINGRYYCTACGWPAIFDRRAEAWFIARPFIIQELPSADV